MNNKLKHEIRQQCDKRLNDNASQSHSGDLLWLEISIQMLLKYNVALQSYDATAIVT